MKKLQYLVLTASLLFWGTASAQYTTINYQVEKNYFNEGQALPAEKPLMFTGRVPAGVDIIEISIFPSNADNDKDRLYLASWKDFDQTGNTDYSLAVSYKLRASEQYDFRFDFFRKLSAVEQNQLTERIIDQTKAYIEANISLQGNNMDLAKSEKRMVKELETIIRRGLSEYRNQNGIAFDGLSPTVKQKLEKLEDQSFQPNTQNENQGSTGVDPRRQWLSSKLSEVETVMETEIRELMSSSWSKLAISRYVDDYETERKRGAFSISAGYGGVHLGGPLDDLDYGASPYLGVAFPLSNSTIAPNFLRNSSVILGAFLQNFKDEGGNTVTGFLVDRPFYLGLDYKLFEFVRFNAGAAFLEKREIDGSSGPNGSSNQPILIRPFVGLSARIDLTVGFGK